MNTSGRLTERTALVTGAATGIGRAIADRFVAEGALVVYADIDEDAAQAAASDPRAHAVRMDVSDEQSVVGAFAELATRGVAPDVVVANAGVQLFGQDARVGDVPLEAWNRTLAVNLTGTFLTLKHAVRSMLAHDGGSIICTGSPTGLNGEGMDFAAYSSTKGGIHALVRATAKAYAPDGIRVNTVVPGYTETSLVSTIAESPDQRAAIVSRTPLGRPGTPEDISGIMVYLASEESAFATGAIFRVDGGMTSL